MIAEGLLAERLRHRGPEQDGQLRPEQDRLLRPQVNRVGLILYNKKMIYFFLHFYKRI